MKEIIEDIKKGIPVIIVDDYDRENEGDVVIAAENATVQDVTGSIHIVVLR